MLFQSVRRTLQGTANLTTFRGARRLRTTLEPAERSGQGGRERDDTFFFVCLFAFYGFVGVVGYIKPLSQKTLVKERELHRLEVSRLKAVLEKERELHRSDVSHLNKEFETLKLRRAPGDA